MSPTIAAGLPEVTAASSSRTAPLARRRAGDWIAITLLTVLYVLRVAAPLHRRLWFDELFTYYIAQAPTMAQLNDASLHTDLNPPLIYLLVRWSQGLFGASESITRLPAALGFYLGSMAVFLFLGRKIGAAWSAAAILLFWITPYFRYAAQARPYGLLLAFFGLTLLSYDEALSENPKCWAVPGIAAGNIGMMLSHVFAPLSIVPFCAAEAVRSVFRKRFDRRIWVSLLAPLAIAVVYIAGIRNFQQFYFPVEYQASGRQILYFYIRLAILNILPGIAIAALAALIAIPFSRRIRLAPAARTDLLPVSVGALVLVVMPVVLNLILMRTQGAFWDRYCITSALVAYALIVAGLGRVTGFRRSSGIALAGVLSIVNLFTPFVADSQTPYTNEVAAIPADIPLVAGSGLTYLEMDHYESGDRLSNLYYLVDRQAAIQFAHSTIFENMPLLTRYFPIRARVAPYSDFVRNHSRFLVLTRADYKEAWILQKLRVDGARIKLTRLIPGPGKNPFELYEVATGTAAPVTPST